MVSLQDLPMFGLRFDKVTEFVECSKSLLSSECDNCHLLCGFFHCASFVCLLITGVSLRASPNGRRRPVLADSLLCTSVRFEPSRLSPGRGSCSPGARGFLSSCVSHSRFVNSAQLGAPARRAETFGIHSLPMPSLRVQWVAPTQIIVHYYKHRWAT